MATGTSRHAALGFLLSACLVLAGSEARAGDAAGCQDPAGLQRYEGSSLVLCEAHDFGEYELPTGKLVSWDYSAQKPSFAGKLDVEGRTSFNIYFVPKGPSSADVFRNYKDSLGGSGFTSLFEAKGAELGIDQGRIFESMGPGGQLFGYSVESSRYLSAVKDEGSRKTYVSLYVIEFQGGVHTRLKPELGQVLVRLDTVVAGELAEKMVVVKASEMEKSIAETGRVTLYGILFDFNKAVLKPDSRPAIEEIAAYLKANPERRLHVVGHTDAVGGFDFNVKLSKARAQAVVAELVRAYGIAADRLQGNGVGMLAPIATNASEEGRAKNRRVELVPM